MIWPTHSSFTRLETKVPRNTVTYLTSHSELEVEAILEHSSLPAPGSIQWDRQPGRRGGEPIADPPTTARARFFLRACEVDGATALSCQQPGIPGHQKCSAS